MGLAISDDRYSPLKGKTCSAFSPPVSSVSLSFFPSKRANVFFFPLSRSAGHASPGSLSFFQGFFLKVPSFPTVRPFKISFLFEIDSGRFRAFLGAFPMTRSSFFEPVSSFLGPEDPPSESGKPA